MRRWVGDAVWPFVWFGVVIVIDGVLAILTIGWFQSLGWWETPPPPEPEAFLPIAGGGIRRVAFSVRPRHGAWGCMPIR